MHFYKLAYFSLRSKKAGEQAEASHVDFHSSYTVTGNLVKDEASALLFKGKNKGQSPCLKAGARTDRKTFPNNQ